MLQRLDEYPQKSGRHLAKPAEERAPCGARQERIVALKRAAMRGILKAREFAQQLLYTDKTNTPMG